MFWNSARSLPVYTIYYLVLETKMQNLEASNCHVQSFCDQNVAENLSQSRSISCPNLEGCCSSLFKFSSWRKKLVSEGLREGFRSWNDTIVKVSGFSREEGDDDNDTLNVTHSSRPGRHRDLIAHSFQNLISNVNIHTNLPESNLLLSTEV